MRCRPRGTVIGLAALAGACQPSPPSSVGLLRKGDASVCVQPDVRAALTDRLRQGLSGYTIRYADTTVAGFDAGVFRMSCVTRAIAYSDTRAGRGTQVHYAVSPNLDAAGLVVTIDDAGLRAFADAVNPAPAPTPAPALSPAIGEAALVGSYVTADRPLSDCDGEAVVIFDPDHRFAANGVEGRWSLAGATVTVVAQHTDDSDQAGEAAGFVWTALTRDGDRLGYRDASGAAGLLQRCPSDEP